MANRDKRSMIFPVKVLADLGFEILATQGTAEVLRRNGVQATVVRKHFDGPGPDGEPTTVQLIADGEIDLVDQHPARLVGRRRLGPRRRLRDPHRRGRRQHPVHHHRPGSRRGRAGHRGAASAATSASARCRTGPGVWAVDRRTTSLFDRVLTRVDPERAHHLGFRAIRAGRPLTALLAPRTTRGR